MKCEKCGEDKGYFSDICLISRKDNTKNCYKVFHPKQPKKIIICTKCFGWK